MRQIIFLDIDGVLNGHEKMSNNYSPIRGDLAERFNRFLRAVPDAQIVVSSSWRYLVHSGSMNLEGLQNLLMSHGVDCFGRLHGITEADEATAEIMGKPWAKFFPLSAWHEWVREHGAAIRRQQIYRYANDNNVDIGVVLDDVDLEMPFQVQSNGYVGLTDSDVERALRILAAAAASRGKEKESCE